MLLKAIVAALCLATAPTLNIPGMTPPPAATQQQQQTQHQPLEGYDYPTLNEKTELVAVATVQGPKLLQQLLPLEPGFSYRIASPNFSVGSRGAIVIVSFDVLDAKGKTVRAGVTDLLFIFLDGRWQPMRDVFKVL
jgi:hypothetical protein